jgi:hypothetical protein
MANNQHEQTAGREMTLVSIRFRMMQAVMAAFLFLPSVLIAGDEGAASYNSALAEDGGTVIEESALSATVNRAQAQESVNALSLEIQELKRSVIALNRDLRVLEEDLLFPSNTQLNVFVSLDVGKFFTLDSVKMKLNGKTVASHIYTAKEQVALSRGGMHKLHMANLSMGDHSLSAIFTGMGPNGREYKRATTLNISKQNGPKYIELRITDSEMKQQPEFSVKQW